MRRIFEEYRLRGRTTVPRVSQRNSRDSGLAAKFAGLHRFLHRRHGGQRRKSWLWPDRSWKASVCWPRHRATISQLLGSILANSELAMAELPDGTPGAMSGSNQAVAIRASEVVRELDAYAGQEIPYPSRSMFPGWSARCSSF